jgi:hypothetical protein
LRCDLNFKYWYLTTQEGGDFMFFDDGDPNEPQGGAAGGDAPAEAPMGDNPTPGEGGENPGEAPVGDGNSEEHKEGGEHSGDAPMGGDSSGGQV